MSRLRPAMYALAVFLLIRAMNRLQRKAEEVPEEPPKPSAEVQLLSEIRDALKTR